jgi:DNA-directed RNA polymerase specialized sigma54-like protein
MSERLLEFSRLELKRKLQHPQEENELIEVVREMVKKHLPEHDSLQLSSEHIKNILHWSVSRINKLSDLLSDDLKFIWVSPRTCKISDTELPHIEIFIENLQEKQFLDKDNLNGFFKEFCGERQLKFGSFMKILRAILSGLKVIFALSLYVRFVGF